MLVKFCELKADLLERMALDLSLAKEINQRDKDIIIGFIKQCKKKYKINHVPALIEAICLLFYHIFEYFTNKHAFKCISLSDNNLTVTTSRDDIDYYPVYGNIQIDTKLSMKYIWRFRIVSINKEEGSHILIGLANKSNDYDSFYYGHGNNGVKTDPTRDTQYGKEWSNSDILEMRLTMNETERSLEYLLNDMTQGIAFNDIKIPNEQPCYMTIRFSDEDDNCVQLLQFNMTSN